MALDASIASILSSLVESVATGVAGNWVSTPVPDRLAILAREELVRWTRGKYASAAIEYEDGASLRRLAVRIYTPRDCHRVEIHGVECGDRVEPGSLSDGSWILVAHACAGCAPAPVEGLRKVDEVTRPLDGRMLVVSLWMGPHAPDGCPSCLPVPKDVL